MIRLRTRPAVLFGAMLVVAMLAFLPMRLALGWLDVGDRGLAARRVDGSIWAGRIEDAGFAGLPLGTLRASLSPWVLLVGRARIALHGPTGGVEHGALVLGRHRAAAEDVTATLATGGLFAPLPVTALALDDLSAQFDDGACTQASGRVRATLAPGPAGIVLPAAVAGDVRCDGAALLLPLTSQAGTDGVTLRLSADGSYHADLVLRADDPTVAARLTTQGFQPGAGGMRLSVQGRL